jgi:3-methyladenine DNA glycosylase AlkD
MLNISAKGLFYELKSHSDPIHAKNLQRFFKTGKGKYGEGDQFWGITVPKQRRIAKKYASISLSEIQKLLNHKVHEVRLSALIILCSKFAKSDEKNKKEIFKFYIKNYKNINNWDLVDISCHRIIGEFLNDKPKDILYNLAHSKNIWARRIAIISTMAFIKRNEIKDAMRLSVVLLKDKHDLIHKAVGWVLREVGKKNMTVLRQFLDKYKNQMPRVMLRYSTEKMSKNEQQKYLRKDI